MLELYNFCFKGVTCAPSELSESWLDIDGGTVVIEDVTDLGLNGVAVVGANRDLTNYDAKHAITHCVLVIVIPYVIHQHHCVLHGD